MFTILEVIQNMMLFKLCIKVFFIHVSIDYLK